MANKEYAMLFTLQAQMNSSFSGAFGGAQKQIAEFQQEIQKLSKTQSTINSYQKQQAALEATKKKIANLQQQYDNYQKECDETKTKSAEVANKMLELQMKIDKAKTSEVQQTQKLAEMEKALKDAGVNTDDLAKSSEGLTAKIDNLKNKQQEAANEAENYGKKGAEAFALVQSAIANAGVMTALREIGEAYAECIKESMKFESAITGVFKTVDGSDEELAAIKQGIKDMSTEMPSTTTEIAAVAEAAGQLGIATEDVLDFTKVMIDLGESTNLTADEAASSFAKFANITGTTADNYSRLGSVVVDLGNNFATTEADIVAMSTRLASAGTLAGFSESEIMALAASMSSVGIEAEAGGTAMTQTLNEIETAVATKSEKLSEFARLAGMSASEFSVAWKEKPIAALQGFIAGLGKLDEQGESSVLVLDKLGLTGVRQSNMLKSLGLAAETLSGAISTADKAWEENTALSIEAEKRYATTESRLKMMQNSYSNLKVAIGDGVNTELGGLIDLSADVLNAGADFIGQHPGIVKGVTAVGGSFALAAGGVTAFGTASKVIKMLELGKLFAVAGPFMGWTAAIAGGVVAIGSIADAYKEAQIEARRYGDEVSAATEEYKAAMGEADLLEENIAEWERLNGVIAAGKVPAEELNAAKQELKDIESWLNDNYGIYMDGDGSVSQEEIDSLKEKNDLLRETAEMEMEIALIEARRRADEAEEKAQGVQEKHDKAESEYNQALAEYDLYDNYQQKAKLMHESEEYKTGSVEQRAQMNNELAKALNAELEAMGSDSIVTSTNFEGTDPLRGVKSGAKQKADQASKDLVKYAGILKEYSDSAYKLANTEKAVIDLKIDDIPVDSVQEFATAAKEIGQQAAMAELGASALDGYAQELTEIAQANGLLEEGQMLSFADDGTLQVLEALPGELEELSNAEAVINVDGEAAQIEIDGVMHKVLEYDATTGTAVLSADGKNASGEINLVTGMLRNYTQEEAVKYLEANTEKFDTNVQNAKAELDKIKDKKITITSVFEKVSDKVKSILGFASGTNYAPEGAHWVGENGPELMWFNGGEKVLDARSSRELVDNYSSANYSANSGSWQITIAPQFTVEGGNATELEDNLQRFSDIIVGNVMDALNEAGVNTKRGAYA